MALLVSVLPSDGSIVLSLSFFLPYILSNTAAYFSSKSRLRIELKFDEPMLVLLLALAFDDIEFLLTVGVDRLFCILSMVAEGPRTFVVSRCSRFEQESLNNWVTLVVEDRV